MQSSANVELTPKEEVTVSVLANDFGNLVERACGVVGLPRVAVCDCNERIPNIPIQEG